MTLSPPSPDIVSPRLPAPRASFLVMAGWYFALVVSFGVYVSVLSGAVRAGCDEACDSDRSRTLLFGLYTATPALFLALLTSLVVLWLVVVRTRIRSASLVGTLAAAPALLVSGILAAIVQAS